MDTIAGTACSRVRAVRAARTLAALFAVSACAHAHPSPPSPTTSVAPAGDTVAVPAFSVLVGRVTAETTTRPISDAEISMPGLGRKTRSDSAGLFVLTDIPRGAHEIAVRRIGYARLNTIIDFTGADTLARMFLLEPRELPVTASEEMDSTNASGDRFRDFHRRQARGIGRFLTHADYAEQENLPLSEVLHRRIPGINMMHSTRTNGVAVASNRAEPPLGMTTGGEGFPPACYAQLFVDGVRVFAPGNGRAPVSINDFRTSEIEAVEFYASPEQTPPELTGAGAVCGTIVLWSRID